MDKKLKDIDRNLLALIQKNEFEDLTLREIKSYIHCSYDQQVYNALKKLLEYGYIRQDTDGSYVFVRWVDTSQLVLPFFGYAQCGRHGENIFDDIPREKKSVDRKFVSANISEGNAFLTRAKGDSMLPHYQPGDWLLIEQKPSYDESAVLLTLHEWVPRIKQVKKMEEGNLSLMSFNPDFWGIVVEDYDELHCLGEVVTKLAPEAIA